MPNKLCKDQIHFEGALFPVTDFVVVLFLFCFVFAKLVHLGFGFYISPFIFTDPSC